jgi:pimeloyl-ACP methyl ester carboxylesterase
MGKSLFVIVAAGACLAAGGCTTHRPYLAPNRLDRGLVVVLTGIEGRSPLNEAVCDGLNDAGVRWGIDLVDWTSHLGPLWTLRAETRNRSAARRVAMRIAEYRFAHPDQPIVLVGQSGGGAMALWIAEALPGDVQVDGIIMVAPAVSPEYMADFALARSRRGAVNFYSRRDWFFLGVGTTIAGTMDGRHESSAGRVGFHPSAAATGNRHAYAKMFQIPWNPEMAESGNYGLHVTTSARSFVANFVAPFVLADKWDEALVQRVTNHAKPPAPAAPKPTTRPMPPAAGTPPTRTAR